MIDKISVFRFCGLTRSPQVGSATTVASDAPNWVYRYDPRPGSWTQILPQSMYTAGPHDVSGNPHVEGIEEPLPRYAHQVVYNPRTKAVGMHGGNAGVVGQQLERGREDESSKERRLDDFWRMSLIRFVDGCCRRSCINLVLQAWPGGGHSEVLSAQAKTRRQRQCQLHIPLHLAPLQPSHPVSPLPPTVHQHRLPNRQ